MKEGCFGLSEIFIQRSEREPGQDWKRRGIAYLDEDKGVRLDCLEELSKNVIDKGYEIFVGLILWQAPLATQNSLEKLERRDLRRAPQRLFLSDTKHRTSCTRMRTHLEIKTFGLCSHSLAVHQADNLLHTVWGFELFVTSEVSDKRRGDVRISEFLWFKYVNDGDDGRRSADSLPRMPQT